MSNSNILHSSSEDMNTPRKYARSKTRVFFVRHGKSIEDNEQKDSVPQSDGAALKHIGKRQAQAAGKYLKIAGVRGVNGSIDYGDDTTRVIETVDGIVAQLIQGDEIKKNTTDALRTTKKGLENENRLMENGEVFIATVGLMKQVRERVNESLESTTEFVLVGHKSNKSGSEQATDNLNKAIDISFEIKNGEIIERDIDADTGKYINPKKHPETLFLNRYNYKGILKTLETIPELSSIIHAFRDNTKTESERYPIWRLQNQINEYFHSTPRAFIDFFIRKDCPVELRVFCVMNLIKEGEIEMLNKFFRNEDVNISDFGNLSSKEKAVLYYYKETYKNILVIRKKSLDQKIIDGRDMNPYFNFSNKEYEDIESLKLVNFGKPIKYIEGKAGIGKSFLLVNIAEKLNKFNLENINRPETRLYYPMYVSLSGDKGMEKIEKLQQDLKKIENIDKYEMVFLIDSIDESNIRGGARKDLDKILLLLSKSGRVIITSRSGYRYEYENKKKDREEKEELEKSQEIIEIKDFEKKHIDEYIERYFDANKKKEKQALMILEKLNGLGENPLLLSMVCFGLENKKFQEYEIQEMDLIKIYEFIIEMRLIDYNLDKKGRDIFFVHDKNADEKRKKAFQKKIDNLAKIGYEELFSGRLLMLEEVEKIVNDENLDIESYNLLFRIKENEKCDFVHQSFKEYFAAKYIFEQMKSKKEDFDFEKFFCRDLKKFDLNFLEMLAGFLRRDGELKEFFLKECDNNESYFSNSLHVKVVFLLSRLDKKRRNNYLNYIQSTFDIYKVLLKYGGEEELSFVMDRWNALDRSEKQELIGIAYSTFVRGYLNSIEESFFISMECFFIEMIGKYGHGKAIDFINCFYGNENITNLGREWQEFIKDNVDYIKINFWHLKDFQKDVMLNVIKKYGGEEGMEFFHQQKEYMRTRGQNNGMNAGDKKESKELMRLGDESCVGNKEEFRLTEEEADRLLESIGECSLGNKEEFRLTEEELKEFMELASVDFLSDKEEWDLLFAKYKRGEELAKNETELIIKYFPAVCFYSFEEEGDVTEMIVKYGGEEGMRIVKERIQHFTYLSKKGVIEIIVKYGGEEGMRIVKELVELIKRDLDNLEFKNEECDTELMIEHNEPEWVIEMANNGLGGINYGNFKEDIEIMAEYGGEEGMRIVKGLVELIKKNFIDAMRFGEREKILDFILLYGEKGELEFVLNELNSSSFHEEERKLMIEKIIEYTIIKGDESIAEICNKMFYLEKIHFIEMVLKYRPKYWVEFVKMIFSVFDYSGKEKILNTMDKYCREECLDFFDKQAEIMKEEFNALSHLNKQKVAWLILNYGTIRKSESFIKKNIEFVNIEFVNSLYYQEREWVISMLLDYVSGKSENGLWMAQDDLFRELKNTEREVIIALLTKNLDEKGLKFIKNKFNTLNISEREMVIDRLIRYGNESGREFIVQSVTELKESEKMIVLNLAIELEIGGWIDFIEKEFNETGLFKLKTLFLMNEYRGEERIDFIKNQFDHMDSILKKRAIEIIREDGGEDGFDFIKEKFPILDDFCKKIILEKLWEIGGKNNILFVRKVYKKGNKDIKKRCVNILSSIGGEGNHAFLKYQSKGLIGKLHSRIRRDF